MAKRNERFVPEEVKDAGTATNTQPGGPANGIEANDNAPALSADDETLLDETLRHVRGLVAEEANRITDDDVSQRLREVLDQVDCWSDDPRSNVDDLVLYGYRIVDTWIKLAIAVDSRDIGLAGDDIDEIITETVARAATSFSAERAPGGAIERQAAFLGCCAESIPQAYRSWHLRAGARAVDDIQELERAAEVGEEMVETLRRAVTGRVPPAIAVLRSWGRTDREIEETLRVTNEVLATFT